MKHYVGIDNASASHSVSIIDESGKLIKNFEITNDRDGFKNLTDQIERYDEPNIALEITHGHLVDYLRTLNFPVYAINPLKIKRFKESFFVSGNKTDRIDSIAIAQYLRNYQDRMKPMIFNSKEIEILKLLGLSHERLAADHTKYTNRLIFLLKEYFPLYNGLFTRNSGKMLLKMIIKYPTWSILKKESDESLINFFHENHYYDKRIISRTLNRIRSYDHYVSEEVQIAISFEAVSIARLILNLKEHLLQIESRMADILKNHRLGEVLASLPGAGNLLASKMLGLMGDNKNRFTHANQAQSLFGTAPVNFQSGPAHKVILRRACNKIGRSVFYKFAFCSISRNTWAKEYYDQQRKKGKTHTVAVRALSNKWLNIIFSMWKNETVYVEKQKILIAA